MRRTVFLYSGEGTSNSESSPKLAKTSRHWPEIERILRARLEIDLEQMWRQEIGKHRCPHSPLLTVICGICLADIWKRWGYKPDVVIGHSLGEVSAAFEAGFYSLEQVLLLAFSIGRAAGKLEGMMAHGTLASKQLEALPVALSSRNFHDKDGTHVTVSGYRDDMTAFLKDNPGFTEMRPPHPWHHPDYSAHRDGLDAYPSRAGNGPLFVSGVTARFESDMKDDHWQRWLSAPINFIDAMDAIHERYADDDIDVIEIGFHPVLEKSCTALPSHRYVSSMFRGEEETLWALFQRRKLDPQPLLAELRHAIGAFMPGLDLEEGLAYQGFTSQTFVEFTEVLAPFFPGLAPQDFYRYKSVEQLIDRFGTAAPRKTEPAGSLQKRDVVIAGMSCRFPSSAETPAQFWRALRGGEDQVRIEPLRGAGEAGFLSQEVSRFDHEYFGIPEAEARTMDPQQILALELAEMLWRDAGIDPQTLDRRRVGVYLGVWNTEYGGDRSSVYFPTGTNPSIVAARIGHQYDLRGPNWVCNTACSSSLVAVHYACKDIEAGRVDFAIAGGVNMILGEGFTESMRRSGFLSASQRCRTFDDSADGYVRAEGGGLLLLAARDLVDRYYASVRGSAVNQNGGRTATITAPHPEAQEEVIQDACAEAGVEPKQVSYVECHGTGTRIGDPIEISALQSTVAQSRESVCYIGSVKSNIGHLESAAGIAGLIKSVLILSNGLIPANLHFATPNQFIDFGSHRLKVVTEETPIDQSALIGVSSFGFGGTNAHVILRGVEEHARKPVEDLPVPFDRKRALPLSAYSLGSQDPLPAQAQGVEAPPGDRTIDIRTLVERTFSSVTNVKTIDPSVGLMDQGLDSMGTIQFVTTLQAQLGIEVETDLLFDHPLVDQLVAVLEKMRAEKGVPVVEQAAADPKSLTPSAR